MENSINKANKYTKRPIVISAEQWFPGVNVDGVIEEKFKETGHWSDRFNVHPDVYIETLEGKMAVAPSDFIITGIKGEKYPCKQDIFEKTYIKGDHTIKAILDELFEEIKHGDIDHQLWLREKITDFAFRKMQ
jgi:hypothetical protein